MSGYFYFVLFRWQLNGVSMSRMLSVFLGYALLLIAINGCSAGGASKSKAEILCGEFISEVYNRSFDSAKEYFDKDVLAAISDSAMVSTLKGLSDKLHENYPNDLRNTIVDRQNTMYEKRPSFFIIVRTSSQGSFGYYFFFVSARTNKILLVSEFAGNKPARTLRD